MEQCKYNSFFFEALFCFFALFLLSDSVYAQYFDNSNSFMRQSLVSYDLDARGFYVKHSNKLLDVVYGIKKTYAYDKKSCCLYVVTDKSNIVVTLNGEMSKVFKRNKNVPQLKDKELELKIQEENSFLEQKFTRLNQQRQIFIDDSIHKAYTDSVEKVQKAKALAAVKLLRKENYMRSHKSYYVPTGGEKLVCSLCDQTIDEDSVFAFGVASDSIYFLSPADGDLGLSYWEPHIANIPPAMLNSASFKYHYEVYKDSLTNDTIDYHDEAMYFKYVYFMDYYKNLKKIAPYGFVDDWDWSSEYSYVTLNLTFTNMNPKTVKYITVYFKVTNDVGDIRKTGCFKGTGPVEEGHSANWDWDTSSYFVYRDASNMSITKIVLTYMNGSTHVLTGNSLKFN